jgi:small subunit ribosomal protein S4e
MSDHMKRIAAPKTWPLKRKASIWAAKQSAGAHSVEASMPATMVLRDMIGVCDTAKEAKRIIGNREMFVDGVAVKNPKAPVGFMDVISIPKMEKSYRMLISDKGKLTTVEIPESETKCKICRIEGKTKIKDGKIQLNLSGGRNITIGENNYKTGDSLMIDLADQKILEVFPLSAGAFAMVIEGLHAGKTYTVSECAVIRGPSENIVKFACGTETVKSNVFVIGNGTPAIKLPEASQ